MLKPCCQTLIYGSVWASQFVLFASSRCCCQARWHVICIPLFLVFFLKISFSHDFFIIKNHSFLLSLYSFFFYFILECFHLSLHVLWLHYTTTHSSVWIKTFCVTDNALVWSCLKIHVSLQPEFVFIQTKLKFWPKSFESDHDGVLSIRCNILERVLLTQRMRSKYYI
jgi:hypothetical protein